MRLIDADKATAVVGYFLEQMGITLFGRKGKDLSRTLLLQVPTIDAVEVVHGKWTYGTNEDPYPWTCSICGEKYPWYPNYCPNCGADMRGDNDESD